MIRPLRPFDYSNDKFIIADMDARDKSYISLLVEKINEIGNSMNKLEELVKNEVNKAETYRINLEKKAAKKEKENVDSA